MSSLSQQNSTPFNRRNHQKRNGVPTNCFTHHGCDPENGLYREDAFQELLCRERKRTERSGKPFTLVGISLKEIAGGRERQEVAHRIASVLFGSTRETDVKGWYQTDTVVGILFCEAPAIVRAGRHATERFVLDALKTSLSPEQLQAIDIFSKRFPESSEDSRGSGPPGNCLYPDSSERHVAHRQKRRVVESKPVSTDL